MLEPVVDFSEIQELWWNHPKKELWLWWDKENRMVKIDLIKFADDKFWGLANKITGMWIPFDELYKEKE